MTRLERKESKTGGFGEVELNIVTKSFALAQRGPLVKNLTQVSLWLYVGSGFVGLIS